MVETIRYEPAFDKTGQGEYLRLSSGQLDFRSPELQDDLLRLVAFLPHSYPSLPSIRALQPGLVEGDRSHMMCPQ